MSGKYFTSFDGTKIYYHATKRDKNKWLVFLHGFGGDLTAWEKERQYFTNLGVSTIAMDLRGHGLSARSNHEDFYKLDNFSKDVIALMEKEHVYNPVVVGHCFGGMVSINLLAKFPKISRGLVLVDTSYKPPFFSYNLTEKIFLTRILNLLTKLPNLKVQGHSNFDKFIGTADWDMRRILSDILHTSLRSYLMICQSLVQMDAKTLLDKIVVPTLVIEGADDTIFPPDVAKYLSQRIKKSVLDVIPGTNHIVPINNPKELEKSIESFLKKINFFSVPKIMV